MTIFAEAQALLVALENDPTISRRVVVAVRARALIAGPERLRLESLESVIRNPASTPTAINTAVSDLVDLAEGE